MTDKPIKIPIIGNSNTSPKSLPKVAQLNCDLIQSKGTP